MQQACWGKQEASFSLSVWWPMCGEVLLVFWDAVCSVAEFSRSTGVRRFFESSRLKRHMLVIALLLGLHL